MEFQQGQPPIYYARKITDSEKDAQEIVKLFERAQFDLLEPFYNYIKLDNNILK